MRMGIIGGSGHFGSALRQAVEMPDLEAVGAAPGSPAESMEPVERQAARLKSPLPMYSSVDRLLDQARPELVVINCHFADQAAAAIEAMERGIHIFVEKPMATSLADLARLKKAYAAAQVELTSIIVSRYQPHFAAARRAVVAGLVGDVRLMSAQKSYRLGTRAAFYHSRQRHGGFIPWVGIYAPAWFFSVSGLQFQEVRAAHSRCGNRGHGDLEVTAVCQFVMEDEVLATAHFDYLRPAAAPSHGDDRLRVAGTAGVLEVREGTVTLVDGDGQRQLPLQEEPSLFADFVKQIRGEGRCRLSADEAFAVTEAALRARDAADSGRAVSF